MTVLCTWTAPHGAGVCDGPEEARGRLREHMTAHGARAGRVELVEVRVGPDLADCYVPTGTAWRAVLASDGRVMFYRDRPPALTAREREVAGLAAEGLTDRQIAARLFISERTVHSHLRNAYAKTGAGNRVQLANWLTQRAPSTGGHG